MSGAKYDKFMICVIRARVTQARDVGVSRTPSRSIMSRNLIARASSCREMGTTGGPASSQLPESLIEVASGHFRDELRI
jgi:hypothetical protein